MGELSLHINFVSFELLLEGRFICVYRGSSRERGTPSGREQRCPYLELTAYGNVKIKSLYGS